MRTTLLLSIVYAALTPALTAQEIPWPEHPRPDFQRSPWVNLNGEWQFAFDPQDVGIKEEWFELGKHAFDRRIVVPFPWESKLSGIGDTEYKGVAWYSREITIPDGPEWKGKDAWLIIGACDFEAKVWVNGKPAGENIGGYLPFEVNLSQFVKPGEKVTVTIRAKDTTDPQQPTGKQVGWYTRNSGIWQTVYIEPRGKAHIFNIQGRPEIAQGTIDYFVLVQTGPQKVEVRVSSPADEFEPAQVDYAQPPTDAGERSHQGQVVTLKVRNPELWSPDLPKLYPVKFEVRSEGKVIDTLESYFSLREISVAKTPGRDYKYICLNGKPIYLRGLLHQSFHPDGVYQYPNDAVMRSDYELCKKTGINFVRIHIKTPIPRELYWADKLGVMVMQDMPCYWKHTPQAVKWYEQMLPNVVMRDYNHPSVFAWVDFNETWGLNNPGPYDSARQEWVEKMYRLTKQLDPTRLVEDNSPCNYDHVATDINSWHFYINDYEAAKKHIQEVVDKTHPGSTFNYIGGRKQGDAPLMNSEYGGIGAGNGDQDVAWCFKFLTNEQRKHDKICGYIYTELSDIEWEHNGYVNYDRTPKEFGYDFWYPGFSLKDLNGADFVVIDAPPMIELKAGRKLEVPIKISHWSEHEAKDLKLRWCVRVPAQQELKWETRAATWKPYQVVDQDPIAVQADALAGRMGALLVEVADGEQVLARNYVNVCQFAATPGVAVDSDQSLSLSFAPGEFSECSFTNTMPPIGSKDISWVASQGSGYYEYKLKIPETVKLDGVDALTVVAELGSRSGDARLDWSARRTPFDRPQTDVRKWPSDVRISVNGVELKRATLPDDPADARGAFSHHRKQSGGYGFVTTASSNDAGGGDDAAAKVRQIVEAAGAERLLRVRFEVPADAEHKGGLTIYGEGLGCFGSPPRLTLTFKAGFPVAATLNQAVSPVVYRASENLKVLMPTAEAGGYEWSYTTDQPAADWLKPEFEAKNWKKNRGGFGLRGTPNAIIGRRWNTSDIWLRANVEVEDSAEISGGTWRIYHDEGCEIYINGTKVLALEGFANEYQDLPMGDAAMKALKPGRNVVAVHCHQTDGGQNIDVGLTLQLKARK